MILPRYAHSLPGRPPSEWETVETHSREVAELASTFAEKFGAGPWGALLGKWHDLGKLAEAFQGYLQTASMETQESAPRVDHSTAGGKHLVTTLGSVSQSHALANALFGHHGGLHDHAEVIRRLGNGVEIPTVPGHEGLLRLEPETFEALKTSPWLNQRGYAFGFFVRMLFSCLVDADYLCTERFLDPQRSALRTAPAPLNELRQRFLRHKQTVLDGKEPTPINKLRREILETALQKAQAKPGLYTYTSPTGSGKTFGTLGFGLEHAVAHGMERIIYVIPYTSITEQTAKAFRSMLGRRPVLEHHSNLAQENQSFASALLSENWDAPVVVTTSVQFFESLHANRPSRARKLHRLARAVIILDEAQTIPLHYLQPCLECLKELVARYGSTVVLATATPPSLAKTNRFKIGLEGVEEVISAPDRLAVAFRRTRVKVLGRLPRQELKRRLETEPQALCIVNATAHARDIYRMLEVPHKIHLSTRMMPLDRRRALKQIAETLARGEPLIVVSTQLVEAGVDLDFPVVFRAACGTASATQAEGRCNREGRLPFGIVYLFEDQEPPPFGELRTAADHGQEILNRYPQDPLGLEAVRHYFLIHYHRQAHLWDRHAILEDLNGPLYNYRSGAERFRYIEENARGIVVPSDEHARRLLAQFQKAESPAHKRRALRHLQPYAVNVFEREWDEHLQSGRTCLLQEAVAVLVNPGRHYDPHVGLLPPPE
jgi:CRISPR-associated endonuclease/helicase Cas3